MLETYVQELGASEIWIRFPQKIRDRVKVLGDLFLRLLHVACDARLPDTPAAMHPSPPAREGWSGSVEFMDMDHFDQDLWHQIE